MASCLVIDCRIQVLEGNRGLAEESIKKALEIKKSSLKAGDKLIVETLKEYASLLQDMGRKQDEAKIREEIASVQASERMSAATATPKLAGGSRSDACETAIQLARETSLKGSSEASLAQWKLALTAAQKQDSSGLRVAYCAVKLGDEYLTKRDNAAATQYYRIAIDALTGKNESSYCMVMALRRIGTIQSLDKEYAAGSRSFLKAADICTKLKADPRLMAMILQQSASMSVMAKDVSAGEQSCRNLLDISDQLTGAMKINAKISSSTLLGSLYMQTNRMSEGLALMGKIASMQPGDPQEYAQQLMKENQQMEKGCDDAMFNEIVKAKSTGGS